MHMIVKSHWHLHNNIFTAKFSFVHTREPGNRKLALLQTADTVSFLEQNKD